MILSREKKKSYKKNIFDIAFSSNSKILEQFRTIRTNIQFLAEDESRSFLITSPNNREGKSTSVANLAISMAIQKKKVLLVDANFRNPDIHTIFKCHNNLGLSNILAGAASLEESINKTEISRLDILTSGPIPLYPAELLESYPMKKLIQEILKTYDFVLFDSPSVLEFSDAVILATHCNAVILVVKSRRTTAMKALETKKALEFGRANLLGVILNEK